MEEYRLNDGKRSTLNGIGRYVLTTGVVVAISLIGGYVDTKHDRHFRERETERRILERDPIFMKECDLNKNNKLDLVEYLDYKDKKG